MKRKSWLVRLQVLGAVPLAVYPVVVLFGLVSFGGMKSWGEKAFMIGLVVHPVIWGVLWWLSWKAFRAGRFTLAMLLSTPPALPTLAVGGFLVAGAAWEAMTGESRRQDAETGRIAAEDLEKVIGAEFVYRSRNQGSFGDLACLADPPPCLPGHSGPPFIDKALIAPVRNGHVRKFHPGPATLGSPQGFASFAYTAVPVSGGRKASFCGDATGNILRTTGGGEPVVIDGRCSQAEFYRGPVPPPAVPLRPSGLPSINGGSPRATATRKPTRKEALRRLEELGYKGLDGGSLVLAASQGKSEAVELFLVAGVPIDTPRYSGVGETAFFAAVRSGYLDTAARLLEAGASVKVRQADQKRENYGQTPLIVLAQYCNEAALVTAVIQAGADVNARMRHDWTALGAAERGHCAEIASILRKAGARK